MALKGGPCPGALHRPAQLLLLEDAPLVAGDVANLPHHAKPRTDHQVGVDDPGFQQGRRLYPLLELTFIQQGVAGIAGRAVG
ncbi:hypothetical protein ES703_118277 [subsurface metagenome]